MARISDIVCVEGFSPVFGLLQRKVQAIHCIFRFRAWFEKFRVAGPSILNGSVGRV